MLLARVEDNINGLIAGGPKEGDLSTTLFIDLGRYQEIEKAVTYTFLRGGIELYRFDKYDDLNGILAYLRGGVYHVMGPVLSAHASFFTGLKDFEDDRADALSFGPLLEFRQQVSRRLWIKQSYRYEYNSASTDNFTFQAHTAGIRLGYSLTAKNMLLLGYAVTQRDYDGPQGSSLDTGTALVGLEHKVTKNIFLNAAYDRQSSKVIRPGVPPVSYVNNIFSVGVTYSY